MCDLLTLFLFSDCECPDSDGQCVMSSFLRFVCLWVMGTVYYSKSVSMGLLSR